MFVQVFQGTTGDGDALRERFGRWQTELAPGAQGWLGSTAGVTDDGRFVAAVLFESAEAARRNSDRPEQGDWWAKTEPLLDDVEFHDSSEVHTFRDGPDYTAKFVQVIQGRVLDEDKARAMTEAADRELPEARPDVTGGVLAVHDGRFTQVVYFTDEASAREGEARDAQQTGQAAQDAMADALTDVAYLDLRSPWHHTP